MPVPPAADRAHSESEVPVSLSGNEKVFEVLVKGDYLSDQQLGALRVRCADDGEKLRCLLVDEHILAEDQWQKLQGCLRHFDFVDLEQMPLKKEVATLLPRRACEHQKAIPYADDNGKISIAMVHPVEGKFVRLLRKKFGSEVPIRLATEKAFSGVFSHFEANFLKEVTSMLEVHDAATKVKSAEDHSIVTLVDSLIRHAIHQRASDLHIEPQEKETVVRERIDGVLHRTVTFPAEVHKLVTVRIKVLANLPTDEHAMPSDGKFTHVTADKDHIGIRVSILPTKHGETIVCRILNSSNVRISPSSLGLRPECEALLKQELDRSWGMILVTGPTGSGKTTTLYSAMSILNSDDVNISTIEDPVEYDLPGANQIQVNEKTGLTFANGLRSIVRQDPDIILVGEIRDQETARIAISSAMTGHLVLSTLHTNDAPTAFPRMTDMGIEPFLLASTVNLVIAQRLVRRICLRCRELIDLDLQELDGDLPITILEKLGKGQKCIRTYHGKGCELCHGSGYHGREGIYEFVTMTRPVKELILKRADSDAIREAAIRGGMTTMLDEGIRKVSEGITTIEEVLRVTRL